MVYIFVNFTSVRSVFGDLDSSWNKMCLFVAATLYFLSFSAKENNVDVTIMSVNGEGVHKKSLK